MPTAIVASDPANRLHARDTVERLVALIPRAVLLTPGFPESPRPKFADRCGELLAVLVPVLTREYDGRVDG